MDYKDIRTQFAASDDVRDAGLTTPPEVVRLDDIPYGPHGRWNLLDLYLPRDGKAPLPVIVSVHGAWTAAHAGEHGLDMDRLFTVGDSAGAQLAAQYCAMLTDPAFGAMYDFPMAPVHIRAAAFHSGHYDFNGSPGPMDQAVMRAYFGPDAREKLPMADTLAHITPAFPPSLVMTSHHDFLKDQAPLLCRALRARGVPGRYVLYGAPDRPDIGHVFHLNIRTPEARACNDAQCAFFLAH